MIRATKKVPRIVGTLTFFVGLFNVISNVSRKFRGPTERIDHYFTVYLNSTAFATALFTGFLLILLAKALRRGKRRAWNVALVILGINLVTELFRFWLHPVQISLSVFLILILLLSRNEFRAKSDPTMRFRSVYVFVVSFSFFFAVGVALFYVRHSSDLAAETTLPNVLLTVLSGFFWIAGPIKMQSALAQDTIDITLGIFGIFIILIPTWAYFRRVSAIPSSTLDEKKKISELVEKFGDTDSLAFFATRNDKSVIWTSKKQAGIAYRVQSGVMLASGDPFGEYSLWPEAIENFCQRAREYGWTPAVMGASEKGGRCWIENAEFAAIEIGDEAIIDISEFTLEGRSMSNVRQTINRAQREGVICKVNKISQLSEVEKTEIRDRAISWRGDSIERGFSMSMDRFMGDMDQESVLVRAVKENELIAFLYFVPWGKVGYSLDRMQRAPEHFPGITELMINAVIAYGKEEGMKYLSLNFAAFRSIIERAEKINAGPILRTLRTLIRFFSGWFQVESLYRFNAKFQPDWNARYILYPSVTDLSAVIWAALRAEKFITGFGRRSRK